MRRPLDGIPARSIRSIPASCAWLSTRIWLRVQTWSNTGIGTLSITDRRRTGKEFCRTIWSPIALMPKSHRSDEHTSELQSPDHLVPRPLLLVTHTLSLHDALPI